MVIPEDLQELAAHPRDDVLRALHSRIEGLRENEAHERHREIGPNELRPRKKIRPVLILLSKFNNPVLFMLIAAAGISAFLREAFDSIIIMCMVLASVFIDFINTYKSEKAVERLEEQVRITAAVKRGGIFKELPLSAIVPGDVFSIVAGDLVPADSIIVEQNDCFVNESVVTGESLPVEKNATDSASKVLLMGTSVVSGEAVAIAARTGRHTVIGKIAERMTEAEPMTAFDKNLRDFSSLVFRLSIILVFIVIALNIVVGDKDAFETLLFAVAIAVGVAPEMLPMIVTTNLVRGAIAMEKNGVIVRNLSAMHNFGSIDILCTDKTGTLTEDHITLIKYVDGSGVESSDVLFWGALSAHYVTGIRRSLDNAIREFEKFNPETWEKVDEVPFDFERKMESIVVRRGTEHVLVVKGAPEELVGRCVNYREGEQITPLNDAMRQHVAEEYRRMSAQGFRVLAIGTRAIEARSGYTRADERDITFLGFLGFLDPPKKSAKEVIQKMADYNIGMKIITGDNLLVTEMIARSLDLQITGSLPGERLAGMNRQELREAVERVNVFSRVTPEQKEDIVAALRENGHVVGYVGDGANDVLALKAADVGISVQNATQIAKESADIILLRRGLGEIVQGVVEGRRTFANIFKYITMALSSDFGNMFSMPIAALFLPFLPMLPTQIILNNLLYDISQFAVPFDNVGQEFLRRAKKFNMSFLKRFMVVFGLVSSLFDLATFAILRIVFGLGFVTFQTAWFLESIATQTLVANIIRSRGERGNRPSTMMLVSSIGIAVLAWLLPYTPAGLMFGLERLSPGTLCIIAGIVTAYLLAAEVTKRLFYRRYGHLIEG
ncbi:MAG: Mg2+-importing ATPase [Candidatus Parcubacteria bacterium]|jgi:Mg2+-importing ATPase